MSDQRIRKAEAGMKASDIENDSNAPGATVAEALDVITTSIQQLGEETANLATDTNNIFQRLPAIWEWGATAAPGTTAARYFARQGPTAGGAFTATEAQGQRTVASNVVVKAIRVTSDAALVTDSITFTLRVATPGSPPVDSPVVVTLAPGQRHAVATGFNVSVVAGERVSVRAEQSGAEAAAAWNGDVVLF